MAADPEAVEVVILQTPGVARFAPSAFVATYLPGRRITGLRVDDAGVEAHLVAQWGVKLPSLANQVRSRVQRLAGAVPVSVFFDDIELPYTVEEPPAIQEVSALPGVRTSSPGARSIGSS